MNVAQGIAEISIYRLIFQSARAEDFKNEGLFGNKTLLLVLCAATNRSLSEQPGRQVMSYHVPSCTDLYSKG